MKGAAGEVVDAVLRVASAVALLLWLLWVSGHLHVTDRMGFSGMLAAAGLVGGLVVRLVQVADRAQAAKHGREKK